MMRRYRAPSALSLVRIAAAAASTRAVHNHRLPWRVGAMGATLRDPELRRPHATLPEVGKRPIASRRWSDHQAIAALIQYFLPGLTSGVILRCLPRPGSWKGKILGSHGRAIHGALPRKPKVAHDIPLPHRGQPTSLKSVLGRL